MGRSWPLAVLLLAALGARGDNTIGYYINTDGVAVLATCSHKPTAPARWSSESGGMGVCVETNSRETDTRGQLTTNYYKGVSCSGTRAFGRYHGTAGEIHATVDVDFPCSPSCVTVTVFGSSPSGGPAVSFIGCPDQLGLPPEARTVYQQLSGAITTSGPESTPSERPSRPRDTAPSSTGDDTSESTTTQSSESQTGTSSGEPSSANNNDPPDRDSSDDDDNGPGAAVIAGATVGSVGGVLLILGAFFLGRRYSGRKNSKNPDNVPPVYQTNQPYGAQTELPGHAKDGHISPVEAHSVTPQGGIPYNAPPSEMAHNYPAAHQLTSERGPYEFPGSYHHHNAQTGGWGQNPTASGGGGGGGGARDG